MTAIASIPYVRPDVRALLDQLAVVGLPPIEEMLSQGRRDLLASDRAPPGPGDLATVRDVTIDGPSGPLACRLFDARADRPAGPAMLFLHGGGFVIGDLDSHAALCGALARGLDLPVLAVDYRLAPEHPFPAAPDDCEAAARWLATSPAVLRRQVTGLVLAGDSAGGHLAVVTALALRDAPAAVPVITLAAFYPPMGRQSGTASYQAFGEGYLLTTAAMRYFNAAYAADPADWRGNPAAADLTGLPRAMVVTASLDPLRDEGRAFAARLVGCGVPLVFREAIGTIHGFLSFAGVLPSATEEMAAIVATLRPIIAEAEADRVTAQAA